MTAKVVPHLIERLRDDLRHSDFTPDALADLLGPVAHGAMLRGHLLPARHVLAGTPDEPAGILARLFSLGDTLAAGTVDRALPRVGADGLIGLGLVASDQAGVRAVVDLHPHAADDSTWWVCSDLPEAVTGTALPAGHVVGIGGASLTLASWTPRDPVERALDLGTGCGVQTLHLAGHAGSIVATDLSERALGMARFTLALAGVSADLRRGDLLEPVVGEDFDLVVSNPPFVITPRRLGIPVHEYRDGGRAGDALVAALVRSVGSQLRPGGRAHLLANWEIPRGADWRDVWRVWLDGTGLDAWVIQREVQDPAEYAETWIRDGGVTPGSATFDDRYAAWLADFASRDVAGIGFGVVNLARPLTGRAPGVRLEDHRGPVTASMGPTVAARLDAVSWLAQHDAAGTTERALLDTAWTVAPDVTEARHFRPGAEHPAVIELHQGGGFGRRVAVDTVGSALVSVSDGALTARAALAAIADLLAVDADEITAGAIPTLRALVSDGLVTHP